MFPLYLLVALPAVAQGQTTLPQVFELRCNWEHETRLDQQSPAPEGSNGIAYSSSKNPIPVENEIVSTAIEVAGVAGTRHFVMPDIGGPLAGMFITIYPDGRSVRVPNCRIHGNLTVHSTLGTCEEIE